MTRHVPRVVLLAVVVAFCAAGVGTAHGAQPVGASDSARQGQPAPQAADPDKSDEQNGTESDKLVPLNKQETVLLDRKGKRVLLKSKVVLREGLLEMILCKKQTKEHESILSIDADAYVIHAGLLALGAKPGSPVRFLPDFVPPTGQKIDIFLQWKDEKGKLRREPAQRWVRYVTRRGYEATLEQLPPDVTIPEESELRYFEKFNELSWYGPMSRQQRERMLALSQDKTFRQLIHNFYRQSQPREMDMHWVFAGSIFSTDESTGEKVYGAEVGDVICVANFTTAMIDVAAESTASGTANLNFEPWTERVPPLGTEVTVELAPVFPQDEERD